MQQIAVLITVVALGMMPLALAIMIFLVMLSNRAGTRMNLSTVWPALWAWLIACLILGIVGVGLAGSIAVAILLLLLLAAVLMVVMLTVDQVRMAERRRFLASLSVAIARGLSVADVARAFAMDWGGGVRLDARLLAEALDRGQPLHRAAQSFSFNLPLDVGLSMSLPAGQRSIGNVISESSSRALRFDQFWQALYLRLSYLSIVVISLTAILVFVTVKLVPEFVQILASFDTPSSVPTRALIAISEDSSAAFFGAIIAIGIFLGSVAVVSFVELRYLNVIRTEPIGLRWLTSRWHDSVVLRALGFDIVDKRSLASSIDDIADVYPVAYVRRRLQRSARKIAAGGAPSDALREGRFVTAAEANVLRSAERAGNLGWALTEIANTAVRRLHARWTAMLGVLTVLVILGLGAVVLFVELALFMPLVDLIWTDVGR